MGLQKKPLLEDFEARQITAEKPRGLTARKKRDTADDINPASPCKDPKLWEIWYIPSFGYCRIYIITVWVVF